MSIQTDRRIRCFHGTCAHLVRGTDPTSVVCGFPEAMDGSFPDPRGAPPAGQLGACVLIVQGRLPGQVPRAPRTWKSDLFGYCGAGRQHPHLSTKSLSSTNQFQNQRPLVHWGLKSLFRVEFYADTVILLSRYTDFFK